MGIEPESTDILEVEGSVRERGKDWSVLQLISDLCPVHSQARCAGPRHGVMVRSGVSDHHAQRIMNANPSSQCPTCRTGCGIAAYGQDSGNWNTTL